MTEYFFFLEIIYIYIYKLRTKIKWIAEVICFIILFYLYIICLCSRLFLKDVMFRRAQNCLLGVGCRVEWSANTFFWLCLTMSDLVETIVTSARLAVSKSLLPLSVSSHVLEPFRLAFSLYPRLLNIRVHSRLEDNS